MNYNEYNWNFDPSNVDTDTTSKAINPWDRDLNATCVGAMCCSDKVLANGSACPAQKVD